MGSFISRLLPVKLTKEEKFMWKHYNQKKLAKLRRELHRNPEASHKEFKTQERIYNYLTKELKIPESAIKKVATTGL